MSHRPYIFMSAVGTQDDVQTLLHEAGHAFHFMESSRTHSLVWNYSGPLEFCEVASMGMELLAQPYLERRTAAASTIMQWMPGAPTRSTWKAS